MIHNNRILAFMFLLQAFIVSCTQENVIQEENSIPLILQVKTEDFVSSTETRTPIEDGYKTVFKGGEQIGITALKDGAVYNGMDNVPCMYDATSNVWTPSNNSVPQLYYYPGVTYIAYYPYDSNMNGKKSEQEIIDAFTPQTDQSTYAAYTASDLMTSTGTITGSDGAYTITFNLQHRMALIGVKATENCITSDGYKYSSPALDFTLKLNDVQKQPCPVSVGTHRYLIKPTTVPQKIDMDFTGSTAVSYTTTYAALAESKYYYTHLHSATTVVRDVQVGDYFYDDGSIIPKGSTAALVPEHCLGLIFKVGAYSGDVLEDYAGSIEKIHGYVISLEDVANRPWGDSGTGDTGANDSYRGYNNTQILLQFYAGKDYAVHVADAYNDIRPTPAGVSRWYLPASNQLKAAWDARNSLDFPKVGGSLFYTTGKKWFHSSTGVNGGTALVLSMHSNFVGQLSSRTNSAESRPIFTF